MSEIPYFVRYKDVNKTDKEVLAIGQEVINNLINNG